MFKRWVILLLVLLALSAAVFWHYGQEVNNSLAVSRECMNYLETRDDSWTSVGDTYFERRCELDNYYSDYNIERRWRNRASDLSGFALLTGFGILVTLFLSFIGRWLLTGRLKWD